MSESRLWNIKQSYKDLYRIYKPKDLDKFTRDFVKKYHVPKGHEDELKALVKEDK